MKNPWSELPDTPPNVLPSDDHYIEAFNTKAHDEFRFDLHLLPGPFFGAHDAPIVILTSIKLVRDAIARKAEIVIMRGCRFWMEAVPELCVYGEHLHFGANPRAPYLSSGNMKSSYSVLVKRLTKHK